ncbi:hypothetical protein DICVIV_06201 [Dictyocaulus viviparus]|uniref:Uncharacterized protein n=1 Tax=Dictyocaulus viviparus TaxID=29172 RepID=A0A0D8XVE3_DICVI|nr:hypothetical protein DICVIV_06201 [Dictyocaulus viviparus]
MGPPPPPPPPPPLISHAAARLRKTGYYEQIRGDVPNLSDGRMAGSDQRLSDGDRSYGTQLNQLGIDSTREQACKQQIVRNILKINFFCALQS